MTRIRLIAPLTRNGEEIPAGREIEADPALARGLLAAGRGVPAPEDDAAREDRRIDSGRLNRRARSDSPPPVSATSAPPGEESAE